MADKKKGTTAAPERKKTKCPITRAQFAKAGNLPAEVSGSAITVGRKEFNTGSMGWYYTGKLDVDVDGVLCKVQLQVSAQIVGSKEADDE